MMNTLLYRSTIFRPVDWTKRSFHGCVALNQRNKVSKSYVQKNYFKPLTCPLPPVYIDEQGQKILPEPKNPPFIVLPEPVPEPIFPMSDGSGPTPKLTMKNGDLKNRTGLIGVRLGMTTMWDEFGVRKPVSVIHIKDNQVVSNRFYNNKWRIQVGALNHTKLQKVDRAMLFVYRRYRMLPKRIMEEFDVSPDACIPTGYDLNAAHFVPGQYVDVQGISRGKGFQGVMKRWGFKGGPASHGNSKNHRTPGSTGQSTTPARVHKGKKMPGNMGNKTCTVKSLRVLKVDPHENLLYVAGPIPGAAGTTVHIRDAIFKLTAKKCFPEDSKIPYPTFLGNPNELPREMLPPTPTKKQIEMDPLLRQKSEPSS